MEVVRTFHDDLYEGYSALLSGPSHIVDKMKEFWVYLSGSFEGGKKLTRTIRRAKRVNEYRLAVDSFFDASPCLKGSRG